MNSISTRSSPCEAATLAAADRIASSLTAIVTTPRVWRLLPGVHARGFAANKKWAVSPLLSPPAGILTATMTDKFVCIVIIRLNGGKFNGQTGHSAGICPVYQSTSQMWLNAAPVLDLALSMPANHPPPSHHSSLPGTTASEARSALLKRAARAAMDYLEGEDARSVAPSPKAVAA